MKEKFYITTAIVYASKKPHIGNIYEAILTDAIARYKRMRGFDVFFLTGTDEHGQKIQACAQEKGISPKKYVDEVAGDIKNIWDSFNISYDKFIRTTDDYHVKSVQHIFTKLYEQGDIYKSAYEGHYCTPCESFWTESQLSDGCCPTCGAKCIKAKEEAYFLRLSKYQDQLIKYIENNDFITPVSRKNEMINNFLKPGLQDLCVSRSSFDWGIPVEFDKGHVIYVWIDALSNYATALGYDPIEPSPSNCSELYKKYWPADVHVIGKDIVRFHTIYWPAVMLALGEPLPKMVLGHPWLLFGEDKMSKSKGNVIYGEDLIKLFGLDAVRYYLLSEMGYNNDGSITYEAMVKRTNSDLANTLGNLVSRTAAMINQYFNGVIPQNNRNDDEFAVTLKNVVLSSVKDYVNLMDGYRIADACEVVLSLLKSCNKYIDETAPWVLAKDEGKKEVLGNVLSNLAESIRIASVLLSPFIPDTSDRIASIFSFNQNERVFENFDSFTYPCAGRKLGKAQILFARIDEKKFFEELAVAKAKQTKTVQTVEETEEQTDNGLIGIEDFNKVKLTVGQVIECEPVPKSDKLLKLIVDIGTEKRQVVSGIANFYSPADLVGKKLILVANLKPVKLRGVDSNGMILAASSGDDVRVVFVDEKTEIGSQVR
ncbi:MAG: methionine--tRNA ligase [Clostridiales bacterium GWF2_36_10]|nr:MAG: methionine--tRNA ligase [Clostridiales bacterium GWF2_36_10]